MTNKDKDLLRSLILRGKTIEEIKKYSLKCSDQTIKNYIKALQPTEKRRYG